jgi:predicted N-acyltransferase
MDKEDRELEVSYELVDGVEKVGKKAWNALVGPGDSPFVEYEWIHALESTGLASTATGWQPVHLCAYSGAPGAANRTLVAATPLYAKVHLPPINLSSPPSILTNPLLVAIIDCICDHL